MSLVSLVHIRRCSNSSDWNFLAWSFGKGRRLEIGTTGCCIDAFQYWLDDLCTLTCPFSPQLIYREETENKKNPFFSFQNPAAVKFKRKHLQRFLDGERGKMLEGSKTEVSVPADTQWLVAKKIFPHNNSLFF